jgi:hypothetical protein
MALYENHVVVTNSSFLHIFSKNHRLKKSPSKLSIKFRGIPAKKPDTLTGHSVMLLDGI